ncbi:MAG: hypothetical protein ABEI96_09115 [Haloarculaceae archaeon]
MLRKSVLVVVAAAVGAVVSVVHRLVPLAARAGALPSPQTVAYVTQTGRFVSFLLVYGLLFGVAAWTGTELDVRTEYASLTLATAASAAVGYLVGALALFALAGVGRSQGVVLQVLFFVGPPLGTGLSLGVVALAGVAVGHFRTTPA